MSLTTFVTILLLTLLFVFPGITLLFAIPEKKYKKALDDRPQFDRFTMRHSIVNVLGISVAFLVSMSIFFGAAIAYEGITSIYTVLSIVLFLLFPVMIIIYWFASKVVVDSDTFTVFRLFRKKQVVPFSSVSDIQKSLTGKIILFSDGKKVLSLEKNLLGYDQFLMLLDELGLWSTLQPTTIPLGSVPLFNNDSVYTIKNNRSIKQSMFFIGLLLIVSSGAMSFGVADLIYEKIYWGAVLLLLLLVGCLVLGIWLILSAFLWRVIIGAESITVRKLFTQKTYTYDQFTRAVFRTNPTRGGATINSVAPYIGKEEIVSITDTFTEYPILVERLQAHGIPFRNR